MKADEVIRRHGCTTSMRMRQADVVPHFASAASRAFVVLDIDGVLADVTHRLPYLTRRPKDWDSFFAAASADPLLTAGAELARRVATTHRIVYLTGRPERIREVTAHWLREKELPDGELLMRADTDRRPSRLMKVERLRRLGQRGIVDLVVDDDIAVVTAVRAAGFTVQQADWMPTSPATDNDPDATLFDTAILSQAQGKLGRT